MITFLTFHLSLSSLLYVTNTYNTRLLQVTKRDHASEEEWKKWTWVSDGDLFQRGAYFVTSGDQDWYNKHSEFSDNVKPGPAKLVGEMTQFTGALGCKVGSAC